MQARQRRTTSLAAKCVRLAGGVLLLGSSIGFAQSPPSITGDARVDKLLGEMTLAEKLLLIHDSLEDRREYQGQAGYVAGVPRLGIPGLRFADGPPGVLTRNPSQAESATMAVAATFDPKIAEENGVVIGREARALGIDVTLQPFVNMDRDLAFKRAYNTFGEDPFLTSEMGAAEIRGIQSQLVMAQVKHFIGFDTAATDVWIDDQSLHEVYLAPFEAAVRAGVSSVMCSYNHVNGPYACGNATTLRAILRDELGFQGFVTSDWGATHSAEFVNAGLDMEMIDGPDNQGYQEPAFLGAGAAALPLPRVPGEQDLGDIYGGQLPEETAPAPSDGEDLGAKVEPKTITRALRDGSVTEAAVTRAAGHVLFEMDRFGYLDGQAKHSVTARAIEANAAIIRHTSEAGAVLLKNHSHALPLKTEDLGSIVLIGPTAGQVDAIGISGERSAGLTERQVGPFEALRQISGNKNIRFAVADDMTGTAVPASLLSHEGQPGLVRVQGDSKSVDAQLDFTAKGGNTLPPNTRATWSGSLKIAEAGSYWLYLQALGTNASLFVDGQRVAITGAFQGDVHGDILQASQDNVLPTTDGLDNVRHPIQLAAGEHLLRVQVAPDTSNSPVQIRLSWYPPGQRQADHDAAIRAAREARVAVVFAWARRAPFFTLAGSQNELIEEVAAVNPHTIVVLNTSQPVALPWIDRVQAVLEMWWPGDEGGWSTANLLLGKVSPSGRLPMTWGRRLEDYPATDPRFPERSSVGVNHRTTYSEGVNLGYRWFDHEKTEPLFAFGHGLSYSAFAYSALRLKPASDGGIEARLSIKNTGAVDADEVPQLYLGAPAEAPPGIAFPVRSLAAFRRVHLKAGEAKTVELHVALRRFQYWSAQEKQWKTPAGARTLSVGPSSRDLRLEQRSPIF